VVLCLGVAACGSPEVLLSLATVEGDTPWESVTRLEVAVSVAGARVGRAEQAVGGGEFSLPGLPVDEDVEVWASGLDEGRAVRSFGHAVIPKGERERCCVVMCFCSVELFDQGACTCGSDGCGGGC
jgi:hypothetical protein